MTVTVLSNEAVTPYLARVHYFAARFNKVGGAEYDDLVQEGSEHVVKQLLKGNEPSGTGMKNAMRDWCRKCRRQGVNHDAPAEE